MGTVKCVICLTSLELEGPAPIDLTDDHRLRINIVYDGVNCIACGNYGSGVFDPMGRVPLLGFVICDRCFANRRHLMVPIVRGDDERDSKARSAEDGDGKDEEEGAKDLSMG